MLSSVQSVWESSFAHTHARAYGVSHKSGGGFSITRANQGASEQPKGPFGLLLRKINIFISRNGELTSVSVGLVEKRRICWWGRRPRMRPRRRRKRRRLIDEIAQIWPSGGRRPELMRCNFNLLLPVRPP